MLESERLILRNYKESDLEDYWEYVTNPKIGPACGWPPYTDKSLAFERLKYETTKPNQFAIVYKPDNKVIGSIELMDYNPERYESIEVVNGAKEIGFLLSEKYWGKGIMPEALKLVMEYAFNTLNVPVIVMSHSDANIQSGRVQEKLGFKIVGRKDNYRPWLDGKMSNCIIRKMTKEEYNKANNELEN